MAQEFPHTPSSHHWIHHAYIWEKGSITMIWIWFPFRSIFFLVVVALFTCCFNFCLYCFVYVYIFRCVCRCAVVMFVCHWCRFSDRHWTFIHHTLLCCDCVRCRLCCDINKSNCCIINHRLQYAVRFTVHFLFSCVKARSMSTRVYLP